MLEDLAGCLKAICLFPLFVLAPGYAIAWLSGIFEFRQRTTAFRLALSIPLSIAICPIVTYLLGRFCGMAVVWTFYALCAVVFVATLRRLRVPREWRFIAGALAIWLVVALGSLIDIQIGDRLYYPTSALDNSVRAAFVHAISSTGIPPQSPLFLPGQPVPLRYHYFWLMMCSLVETASRGAATARQALIAGTFWCGAGLMALVALYLRLFAPGDPARLRRRTLAAFLLLGITGLDIIPTAFFLLLHVGGALPFVMPSVEWWNEHVDWFLYSTVWAPHALSSLLACFIGFLLLWKAPSGGLKYSLLAGMALASSIGESIYVAFVFAVCLTAWTILTVVKKWFRETGTLAAAGAVSIAMALPYLLSLSSGPAEAPVAGGAPLQWTVRTFSLAALVPSWHGMTQTSRLLLVNLPLLPLNYLLEFGFFLAVAAVQWQRWRRTGEPLTRQQWACVTLAGTTTLICTFVRSSVIGCNDLGWRGFLVAQFVLLLCAADFLAEGLRVSFGRQRQLAVLFLVLGAMGTVYDVSLTRFYPVLADRGVVPPLDWMAPDRQFGKRTYAARSAYEWAQTATPDSAAIQFNPKVVFQETTALAYADRRAVTADATCNTSFGGEAKDCRPIVSRLNGLYALSSSGTQAVCENLPADLIIAKDTDPVWRDRDSWVWREQPVYQSAYIRMFACRQSSPRTATPSALAAAAKSRSNVASGTRSR